MSDISELATSQQATEISADLKKSEEHVDSASASAAGGVCPGESSVQEPNTSAGDVAEQATLKNEEQPIQQVIKLYYKFTHTVVADN